MKTAIVAAALLGGCINNGCRNEANHAPDAQEPAAANVGASVSYLCVGMETSARFGSCPGCEKDARSLALLLSSKYGYSGEVLISKQATKAAVSGKLKAGVDGTPEGGLFIFCYSGHGGQEYLGRTEPDGADRQDEYLCLYDAHMLDDEIWEIVSKCKGRVFLYFDACHSATMYRSVRVNASDAVALSADNPCMVRSSGFTFMPKMMYTATAMDSGSSSKFGGMLCWSGCKESQYSYGGSSGGVLTRSLVRNWEKGMSYTLLWNRTRLDVVKEQPTQTPVQTIVGDWPTLSEAFK